MDRKQGTSFYWLTAILLSCCFLSCNGLTGPSKPADKEIVVSPEEIDARAGEIILQSIQYATNLLGKLDDSIQLGKIDVVQAIYAEKKYIPLWSQQQKWLANADSLYQFLAQARNYGLFPEDYHLHQLTSIRERILADTGSRADRKDAALWARADMMLTDAFVTAVHDLKWGRLQPDSITLREDTIPTTDFYQQEFNQLIQDSSVGITAYMEHFEPASAPYQRLRNEIPAFVQQADFSASEKVPYPVTDTVAMQAALQVKLMKLGFLDSLQRIPDSTYLSAGLARYQKANHLTDDGKWGPQTAGRLNQTDQDKFIRLAITLDKFKLFPDSLPDKYVLVNIPGYYLELWDHDSVALWSKVVVGKPNTRTPELNSALSEMITYPQWTIPTSIIAKEILPGVKKNPDYLSKKGFSLVSYQGEEIDPYMVDWNKYSKNVPFKVVQGSGDANALGILKFNFRNKYSVYLHDTNQRYLFSKTERALSHGCVRVKQWEDLMYYLLQNDKKMQPEPDKKYAKIDSMYHWLARKEKHSVRIVNRMPLYIRYLTCSVQDGKLTFFDDVYGIDDRIQQRFFAGK